MSSAKKTTTPRSRSSKRRTPVTPSPTPPKNVRSGGKRGVTKKPRSASVSGSSRTSRKPSTPSKSSITAGKKTPKSPAKAKRPRTKTQGSAMAALTPDSARHQSSASLSEKTPKKISPEAWSSVLSPSAGLSDSGASLSRKRMFVASPDLLAKASTSKAVAFSASEDSDEGESKEISSAEYFEYNDDSQSQMKHEDSDEGEDSSYNSDDDDSESIDIPDYSFADQALGTMFHSLSTTQLTKMKRKDSEPNMMDLHRSALGRRVFQSALTLTGAASGSNSSSSSSSSDESDLDVIIDEPTSLSSSATAATDDESGDQSTDLKKTTKTKKITTVKKKTTVASGKPSKLKKLTIDTTKVSKTKIEPQSPTVFGRSKRRTSSRSTPKSAATPTGRTRSVSRPKSPLVFGTPTPRVKKKPLRKASDASSKSLKKSISGAQTPGRKQTRKGRSATVTNPAAFRIRPPSSGARTPKTPGTPKTVGRARRGTTTAPMTPKLTAKRSFSKTKSPTSSVPKSPSKKKGSKSATSTAAAKKKKRNAWLSKLSPDDLMVQHVLRDVFVFAVMKREKARAEAAAGRSRLLAEEQEQQKRAEAEDEADSASDQIATVKDDEQSKDEVPPVPSSMVDNKEATADVSEDHKADESKLVADNPDGCPSADDDQSGDQSSPVSTESTLPSESTVLFRAATTSDVIVLTPADTPTESSSDTLKKLTTKKSSKSGKRSSKKKTKMKDSLNQDELLKAEMTDHSNEKIVRLIMIYHLEMQKICVLPPLNVFSRIPEFEKALFAILKKSKRRDFMDLSVSYPLIWDGSMGFPPGSTFENADYYYSVRVSYAIMHEMTFYIRSKLTKQQSVFFLNEVKDYYGKCLNETKYDDMNYQE